MELGFALPTSGPWATPDNIATVAQAADTLGYRTLWTFQRVLFPTASDLPPVYHSVLDPVVTLGFAAALTRRARLGLGVVNGPFYAPAVLAKQLAALDVLSAGRLDAGIGLGWSPDEYAAAGVPMRGRGRRFDEWLDALRALLTEDPVEFAGEHYTVPRAHVLPRAVQQPHPPLLIGGGSEAALHRAATRGDGWISSSAATLDDIRRGVAAVRDAAERAGKRREDVRCVVRGVTRLRPDAPATGSATGSATGAATGSATGSAPAERRGLYGSLEQIREELDRFAAAGVDEVFLDLNFDPQIGAPDADPARAMETARTLLEAFAPE